MGTSIPCGLGDIKIWGNLLVRSKAINIAMSVIRPAHEPEPEPEPAAFPFWVFRENGISHHITSLQAYKQSSYEHAVRNIVGHSQHSLVMSPKLVSVPDGFAALHSYLRSQV